MTLELLYYIILISTNIYVVNKVNYVKYIYIPAYLVFIIIMRLSGFDTDIQAYLEYMHYFQFWQIKEFVFFGLLHIAFLLINDETSTFILIDFIYMSILVYILNKYNNLLFLPIITLSFPFILGVENIYRQLHAILIFFMAYLLQNDKKGTSITLFILSIFTHNSIILFIQKLFNINFSKRLFIGTGVLLNSFIFFKSKNMFFILLPFSKFVKFAKTAQLIKKDI